VLGILFVVVATFRFVRTARLLDDQEMHSPGVTVDLVLSVPLALLLRRSASTSCLADALV
jgi:hypothetical protein